MALYNGCCHDKEENSVGRVWDKDLGQSCNYCDKRTQYATVVQYFANGYAT